MSARFVSAGGEELKPREGLSQYDNDAWTKARQKIEELKKPQPDAPGTQEGGKSLYEHLQAQKAAKQEAFEEATKLRNQFRPLDDSEVAFLESIKRKEIAEATTVRKETEEQLAAFRRERAAAEEKARELEASQEAQQNPVEEVGETWTTTKKKRRRADLEDTAGTSKSIKTSIKAEKAQLAVPTKAEIQPPAKEFDIAKPTPQSDSVEAPQSKASEPVTSKPAISLVTYDSDSDE